MKFKFLQFMLALSLGVVAGLILLLLPSGQSRAARAADYTVCPEGAPTCDYVTIQEAVDAAADGDVIKVATGLYTDVNTYAGLAQVVYISKTVTLQGGYTPSDWHAPDPVSNPATLDAQGEGRVLYITGNVSPTIEGLRIVGGDATGLGGGLSGKNAGGGVYVINARPVISGNWIANNFAHSGGGLFFWNSDATLVRNTVVSNTAQLYGGGLTLRDSDAMLNENSVAGNSAPSGGGLFLHASDAILNGNVITTNVAAAYGGGLYLSESDAVFQENAIAANTADHSGGLYLYISDATLMRNTIVANTAAFYGGGLYLYTSNATFHENTVVANEARYGGGLYLYFHSDATLVNTVVADNQATDLGGGLYVRASSPRLLHTTLARNASAAGSGVYVTRNGPTTGTITMTNTILAGHAVGIEVTEGNGVTLEASLWGSGAWANDVDWKGEGDIFTGTVNWWGDPAFLAPDKGDYHITKDSAARDAGVDAGVLADIDGQTRPRGVGYDIGADELDFNPALAVTVRADHNPVQAGTALTFTLRLTNTGDVTLRAIVTDTLPAQATPTGALTWTPDALVAGGVWEQPVAVTVALGYAGPLVNEVEVTAQEGATGASTAVVTVVEKLITVGPQQGGSIVDPFDDGASIVIQVLQGAVAEVTQLGYTVIPAVADPPPGFAFAGYAFKLDAYRNGKLLHGLSFEKPITVTIHYAEMADLDANTLELRCWDGHAWSTEGITVVDRDVVTQRLLVRVMHLSEFAAFAREQQHTLYLPLALR